MIKKENKFGTYLRKGLYDDLADLVADIGFIGLLDYLGGFSINHPMEDIAAGAGIKAGRSIVEGRTSGLVTSAVAAGLSMYPDIAQLAASGDIETFLKGVGVKTIGYGVGAVASGLLTKWENRNYDGRIEINAVFKNETDANRAFEYLKGLFKVGNYIRISHSSVDELQKTEKGYSLHARIFGITQRMRMDLKPSLETYFSETLKPLDIRLSDVVKVK